MFLFLFLPETSGPSCIHLSWRGTWLVAILWKGLFSWRQILRKIYFSFKKPEDKERRGHGQGQLENVWSGKKTVTDHSNNTKLAEREKCKAKPFCCNCSKLKEITRHMHVMQTYSLAKVNLTQLSNVKFHCGLSNDPHFQSWRSMVWPWVETTACISAGSTLRQSCFWWTVIASDSV